MALNKALTYQSFINNFGKDKLSKFYHVYGPEEYLKKKVLDRLINRLIPEEQREFDLVFYYGDDCEITQVLDSISTEPFFATDKVIIVRKFDAMKTANQQKMVDFLSNNEIFNYVIFTSHNIDNRLKIAKEINKLGVSIHCRSPYKPEDMLPWLNGEITSRDKEIDQKAAYLFVNRVELDYLMAANELEKLLLYTINTRMISVADVQVSTGDSRSYTIFDLINAVGDRVVDRSFIITENMLENKESAVFLITMLLRLFIQLWKINNLVEKGVTTTEIESKYLADIYISFRKNYLRFARNYSLSGFPEIFSILLEADSDLKSLNLDEKLIIERMLFRIFALR